MERNPENVKAERAVWLTVLIAMLVVFGVYSLVGKAEAQPVKPAPPPQSASACAYVVKDYYGDTMHVNLKSLHFIEVDSKGRLTLWFPQRTRSLHVSTDPAPLIAKFNECLK